MKLYAIEHKPTGRMMPTLRRGRGYTALNFHLEGFEKDFRRGMILTTPRLFCTKIAAARALAGWLKGEWKTHRTSGGMYGDDFDEYSIPPKEPPADRKPEETQIIEMILSRTHR